MAKLIAHVAAHYEIEEVEFGRVYRWHPVSVVVECRCTKRSTLKRFDLIRGSVGVCECGKDNTARIREEVVLWLLEEDIDHYEDHHHPWRYWPTTRKTGIPV